ncbi:MAG: hypothetical protein ACYC90_00315 [Candidatus Nanopelagicales bacterium]
MRRAPAGEISQQLQAFCADPKCRKSYDQMVGPGRPQLYCSETCRRRAQTDLRQLRSRLRHFEDVVSQLRIDVASHAREDGDDDPTDGPRRKAELAIAETAGAVRFLDERDDPAADQLRKLYAAVAPLFPEV